VTSKVKGRNNTPKPRLNQVIAAREYLLATSARKNRKVYVRFGKPLPRPDHPSYSCVYQIEGLHEHRITRRMYGVDTIQALELAMKTALVELVCTEAYDQGRLTWLGSPDLGLPISNAIRDKVKPAPNLGRGAKPVAGKITPIRPAKTRRPRPTR